jgi:hypothetical protein
MTSYSIALALAERERPEIHAGIRHSALFSIANHKLRWQSDSFVNRSGSMINQYDPAGP